MKQILKKIDWFQFAQMVVVMVVALLPLMPMVGHAALDFTCPQGGLNCNAGTNINDFIRTIINWILSITLGVAILFLIIGGFRYITSAGNEDAATAGRGTVINALIGIVIIVLSYVIVNVVARFVSNGGNGTTP